VPDLDHAGGGQRKEHQRLGHGGDLRADDHLPLVDPVGEDAAERRKEHRRRELQGKHDTELDRAAAQQEDEPRLADRVHPGADQADDLAGDVEPVVAVAERTEAAPEAAAARCATGCANWHWLPRPAAHDSQLRAHREAQDSGRGGQFHKLTMLINFEKRRKR
jgi:hypothetical protein